MASPLKGFMPSRQEMQALVNTEFKRVVDSVEDSVFGVNVPQIEHCGHTLNRSLAHNLFFDFKADGEIYWEIQHPAVIAEPYRPELIPVYNQMYADWMSREK